MSALTTKKLKNILEALGLLGVARKFIKAFKRIIKYEETKTKYYSILAKIKSPLEYHGVKIPTSSKVFDKEIRSRFLKGNYEEQEVKAIKKYLKQSSDVVGLGASIGFITTFIEKRFDSMTKVVAVEANPNLIPVLKEVKRINGVEYHIEKSAYHSELEEVSFNIHHLTVGGGVFNERPMNK
ncbi:hypothetical protein [Salinibacter ruber]|uniref:hypothetical protein n=1 Tax=Salinibacter ruber TaxID=146919 RepID=UPI002168BDD9|nr:hypothetical protein [Salinibacter ruber]MCS4136404.1 hypothetical protein [Salinibacter ruber]